MRFITHLAVGLLFSSIVYMMALPPLIVVLPVVGSLLPKIDNISLLHGLKRKVFHNVWFLLIAAMFIAWPGTTLMAVSFSVGVLSHLFLDFFSKEGVYPFWPQELVHVELKYIENENIIVTLAGCLAGFLGLNHYFGDLLFSLLGAVAVGLVINKKQWK